MFRVQRNSSRFARSFDTICLLLSLLTISPNARALDVFARPEADGIRTVILRGQLSNNDSAAFEQVQEVASDLVPTLLIIASGGGQLGAFATVGEIVRRWAETYAAKLGRPLDVEFVGGCASACSLWLTMWTQTQTAHPDVLRVHLGRTVLLGFHAPLDADNAQTERALADYIYMMKNYGANAEWFAAHKDYFASTQLTMIGPRTLCAQSSGLVDDRTCADLHAVDRDALARECQELAPCASAMVEEQGQFAAMGVIQYQWLKLRMSSAENLD